VVLLNAAIGFATELQAVRSMEALRRLGHVRTRVRRGGRIEEVPAEDLVLGDIVIVEGGDVVTADLRLIDASKLQVDESPLTGESSPVDKTTAPLPADAPLADRTNMLFKGTAITRGSAMAIVVAAGMQTELGRISSLVETAEDTATPLEIRLAELGRGLIAATLGIAAAAAVSGILRGRELFAMIETSVVLAVAAIPEGLPIVATIALARGMWRMARRNALVNRLSAVETLGSAQIICTDKTGTLTENRLTASRILLPSETLESDRTGWCDAAGRTIDPDTRAPLRELLEVGVLCNNASISSDRDRRGVGDRWRSPCWRWETTPRSTGMRSVRRGPKSERRRSLSSGTYSTCATAMPVAFETRSAEIRSFGGRSPSAQGFCSPPSISRGWRGSSAWSARRPPSGG